MKGDYAPAEWPALWRAFQKEIKPHVGRVRRLTIGKPATNGTTQRLEKKLGTMLPAALSDVFRTVTGAVHLEWRRDTLAADIRQYFVDMQPGRGDGLGATARSGGRDGVPRAISSMLGPKFEREATETMERQMIEFIEREQDYMRWLRRHAQPDPDDERLSDRDADNS